MTQAEYLEILFNEQGFNRIQRNGYLSLRFGRTIRFLDDLSKMEAHQVIEDLKARRVRYEPPDDRDPADE